MSAPGVAITHADGNPPPDMPHDNFTRLGAVAIHVGCNPIQVSPPLALNVFTRILHNTHDLSISQVQVLSEDRYDTTETVPYSKFSNI